MRGLLLIVCALLGLRLGAIDASNRYRSPRNPERAIRRSTELIVLHTTEAPARSSLNKVSDRGECHFVVDETGRVYRIIDRDKEAFHAGRSMWNGKEDVDKFSIGIECVGYHDKPMGMVQLKAIATLVKELKAMYHLTDDKVVCHSHIAYGSPNRYHRNKHRGRKRCGMLFATPSVRTILGLKTRPAFDPDVRAKRLVVADDYLNRVLYGRGDFMSRNYPNLKLQPAPKPQPAPQPRAVVKAAKPTFKTPPRSIEDLKARGFNLKGVITKERTAAMIVGEKWNKADTYYTIRDKVFPGNIMNPAKFEKGMSVWTR